MTKIVPAILMAGLVLFFSAPGFVQVQAAAQPTDKVYVVFLNDAKVDDYVVSNLEAVDFQGVKVLKGTAVNLPGWVKNSTAIYFSADKVVNIVEYNSLNDYVTSVK